MAQLLKRFKRRLWKSRSLLCAAALLLAQPAMLLGWQAAGHADVEAARTALHSGKPDEALGLFDKVRVEAHASGDAALEADAISGVGEVWVARHDDKKAAASFHEALSLRRKVVDTSTTALRLDALKGLADSLDKTAGALSHLDDHTQSLDLYMQELAIQQQLKTLKREAITLHHIGAQQTELARRQDALKSFEQALALFESVGDRRGEAIESDEIGSLYDAMSEYERAVEFHQRALAVLHELKDQGNEGYTLTALASSYQSLGDSSKAIPLLLEAVTLEQVAKNPEFEYAAIESLGTAYDHIGEYEKAIDAHDQSLALAHKLNSEGMVAGTLEGVALVYNKLNQTQKAIDLTLEALKYCDRVSSVDCQMVAFSNLGEFYEELGDFPKSLEADQRALKLSQDLHNRSGVGIALTNLGQVEEDLKQPEDAGAHYMQAVQTTREIKDRPDEEDALYRLGALQVSQGKIDQGKQTLEQALVLQRAVGDRQREARTLRRIADLYAPTPQLAVFFGKEAVNTLQSIRVGSKGLAGDLRKSYLEGNARTYRQLADTLMDLGRLGEAQQILNLLKEDEVFEFVRRDPSDEPVEKRQADLTPEEAAWNKKYQEVSGRLVELANERDQLLSKKELSTSEKARLVELDKDYEIGNQGFEKFLTALVAEQAADAKQGGGGADLSAADLRETSAMQDTLLELGHGSVAIYTLVGENTFRSILVAPNLQKGYVSKITAAELNRKVFALRQALLDPTVDPRPLAQEMYTIILGPMAADLRQAHAQTLMVLLDGALRYVPIAALYDGQKYLIESYKTVMFTPASTLRLKDAPGGEWDAVGFGVSKSLAGAPALPGVARELEGIIKSAPTNTGVLPGEIKLNDDFTEDSMRQAMRTGKYTAVHIASHFRLAPGNDASSFLLLGDGEHLSLADVGVRLKGMFRGVNLLTLSACETGVGLAGRDGREVEGFGVIAQRNGAKSVVASLWSVSDNSTSILMQHFYRNLAEHADTKLDALRNAQLSLLHGEPKSSGGEGQDFVHPFYWAPFFMMGNWL